MTEEVNIPAQGEAVVVKHTGSHYLLSRLPEWNLFPAWIKIMTTAAMIIAEPPRIPAAVDRKSVV